MAEISICLNETDLLFANWKKAMLGETRTLNFGKVLI